MLPARIIADLNIGGCELMFDNFDIDVKQWQCGTMLGKGFHHSLPELSYFRIYLDTMSY